MVLMADKRARFAYRQSHVVHEWRLGMDVVGQEGPAAQMSKAEVLVIQSIRSFYEDPPGSDFQRGYLAALRELAAALQITVPESEVH